MVGWFRNQLLVLLDVIVDVDNHQLNSLTAALILILGLLDVLLDTLLRTTTSVVLEFNLDHLLAALYFHFGVHVSIGFRYDGALSSTHFLDEA